MVVVVPEVEGENCHHHHNQRYLLGVVAKGQFSVLLLDWTLEWKAIRLPLELSLTHFLTCCELFQSPIGQVEYRHVSLGSA